LHQNLTQSTKKLHNVPHLLCALAPCLRFHLAENIQKCFKLKSALHDSRKNNKGEETDGVWNRIS